MNATVILAAAVGGLLLAAGAVAAVYRVARADEAFVRTGLGGPLVVLDRGALVLPVVHRVIPVSLRIMDIELLAPVGSTGESDGAREVVARIHVRVEASPAQILRACRGFAGRPVTLEAVEGLLSDLLGGAVEAALAADPHGLQENWQKVATNIEAGLIEALAARGMSVELLTLTLRRELLGHPN